MAAQLYPQAFHSLILASVLKGLSDITLTVFVALKDAF
jgi:hypothetical protein